MADVVWKGRPGRVEMPPTTPADYAAIDEVRVPQAAAYLLLDVDTGPDLQDVRPEDALIELRRRGRTPLTIDEGVALLVQQPGDPRRAQRLLAAREPAARHAAGAGDLDELQGAAPGLVLGPQPAHLARVGVRLGACGPGVVGFGP